MSSCMTAAHGRSKSQCALLTHAALPYFSLNSRETIRQQRHYYGFFLTAYLSTHSTPSVVQYHFSSMTSWIALSLAAYLLHVAAAASVGYPSYVPYQPTEVPTCYKICPAGPPGPQGMQCSVHVVFRYTTINACRPQG